MKNTPDKLNLQKELVFEHLLEQDAGALNLIKEAVPHITNWPRVKKQLLWGIMLNIVTVNIWNLQYILPTCGLILLFLALRELRRENRWLYLSWLFTIVALAATAIQLTLQGTVYDGSLATGASLMGALAEFLYLCTLLLGLSNMREKAGLPPWTPAMKSFLLLYLLWIPILLFLQRINSTMLALLVFWGMAALLFRSFRTTLTQLQDIGYTACLVPKRLKDLPMGALLAVFLILCTTLGMTIGQRYPMNWESVNLKQEHHGQEALIAELVSRGVPEHILLDLTAEDVASLAGATKILVLEDSNSPYAQGQHTPNGARLLVTNIHIGFESADGVYRWKLLYHFRWDGDPGLRKTAHFAGCALTQFLYSVPPSGRVLYDDAGLTYAGDYYHLDASSYGAAFSPPSGGLAHRGYILFEDACNRSVHAVNGIATLFYQDNSLRYPETTAKEASRHQYLFSDPEGFYEFQFGFFGKHSPSAS